MEGKIKSAMASIPGAFGIESKLDFLVAGT